MYFVMAMRTGTGAGTAHPSNYFATFYPLAIPCFYTYHVHIYGFVSYVSKKLIPIDGAILIWGATTPEGRTLVTARIGFAAVLTLGEIVKDLQSWESKPYYDLLAQRRQWSNELYDALLGNVPRTDA